MENQLSRANAQFVVQECTKLEQPSLEEFIFGIFKNIKKPLYFVGVFLWGKIGKGK